MLERQPALADLQSRSQDPISHFALSDIILDTLIYRIWPIYRIYPYKRTVKHFCSLPITASVLFVNFFVKAYVVGTYLKCMGLSTLFAFPLSILRNSCIKSKI